MCNECVEPEVTRANYGIKMCSVITDKGVEGKQTLISAEKWVTIISFYVAYQK